MATAEDDKRSKPQRTRGLEIRVLAMITLAVVGGGLIIGLFLQVRTRPDLEQVRDDSLERSVLQVTADVDRLTSGMERHAQNVARAGEALYRLHRANGADVAAFKQVVSDYLIADAAGFPQAFGNGLWFEPFAISEDERYFGYYAQLDASGTAELTLIYNTPEYDYPNQSWYTAAVPTDWPRDQRRPSAVYWTPSYYDATGAATFQTVNAVMYDGNRILGVATTDWTLREMQGALASLPRLPGSTPFLVDGRTGNVVDDGQGGHDVPLANTAFAAGVDLSIPAGQITQTSIDRGGVASRLYTNRSASGMVVGFVVPDSEIVGPVDDLQRSVVVAIGLGLVIALILGAFGAHRLLSPLASLTAAVNRVAKGQLDTTVDVRGAGELTSLSIAFNNMTAELKLLRHRHEAQIEEITELSKAAALAAQAEELARSNADLSQFAYVAAHDLRAPLGTINGFADLILEDAENQLDDASREYVIHIKSAAVHTGQLVDDLLNYSRIGTQERRFEHVRLRGLLDDVVEVLDADIEQRHAVVTIGELPDVSGDEPQLRQLFQNLIGNAIKFVPPERTPEIAVVATQVDGGVEIAVSDNGIGIDPEFRDRVFGMFQRLHTQDAYPGTGIGLAICKRVVERHGGSITLEACEPHGTTVRFRLPAG